ncbi:hypothetical protein CCHR01_16977 [Colletotrichum chrysophilum]|uniref:Uncharacterized protein n=1 Tax=Colletotrichum chrysophilum TaxID=1836956 RepID=A0AAD9E7B5_9PEZI|nr:hypothetical protein CCHR01_16977 [Colletotrichum chrysophilum]
MTMDIGGLEWRRPKETSRPVSTATAQTCLFTLATLPRAGLSVSRSEGEGDEDAASSVTTWLPLHRKPIIPPRRNHKGRIATLPLEGRKHSKTSIAKRETCQVPSNSPISSANSANRPSDCPKTAHNHHLSTIHPMQCLADPSPSSLSLPVFLSSNSESFVSIPNAKETTPFKHKCISESGTLPASWFYNTVPGTASGKGVLTPALPFTPLFFALDTIHQSPPGWYRGAFAPPREGLIHVESYSPSPLCSTLDLTSTRAMSVGVRTESTASPNKSSQPAHRHPKTSSRLSGPPAFPKSGTGDTPTIPGSTSPNSVSFAYCAILSHVASLTFSLHRTAPRPTGLTN